MRRSHRVRASDLYDLAECPHRLHLDRTLPEEQRTPPDAGMRLLLEAGLEHERRVTARLGYPAPTHPHGDHEAGARATESLMRDGVSGIDQGVLLVDDRYLAIPDLLERREGRSALGAWHYVPGDVKAGLTPRADQVLQVAFAAHLLEAVQGVRPSEGFLVLGDGRRETIDLATIEHGARAAIARAEAIARGEQPTRAFLGAPCSRCRWRRACVPQLLDRRDLSLVDGMTRARREALERRGIATMDELAAAAASPELAGLGASELALQARALAEGRTRLEQRPDFAPLGPDDALLAIERNPLDSGRVGLVATARGDEARVVAVRDDDERACAAGELFERLGSGVRRVLVFGTGPARALGELADLAGVAPSHLAALEARLVNLRAVLRRAAARLPVRRYELDEICAALAGEPLPDPLEPPAPAFVDFEAHGARALTQLGRLASWLGGARP